MNDRVAGERREARMRRGITSLGFVMVVMTAACEKGQPLTTSGGQGEGGA